MSPIHIPALTPWTGPVPVVLGAPVRALALLDGLVPATLDVAQPDVRGGRRIEIRETSFQLGPDGRAALGSYRRFFAALPVQPGEAVEEMAAEEIVALAAKRLVEVVSPERQQQLHLVALLARIRCDAIGATGPAETDGQRIWTSMGERKLLPARSKNPSPDLSVLLAGAQTIVVKTSDGSFGTSQAVPRPRLQAVRRVSAAPAFESAHQRLAARDAVLSGMAALGFDVSRLV